MADITVLGSGGWGIALGLTLFENGHNVTLWTKFSEEANSLNAARESKLLPGITIPKEIAITTDTSSILTCDIAVMAVPSFAVRETAKLLKNKKNGIIVNVAKGFEKESLKRLSVTIEEETTLPVIVLSGPSHAEEVARKVPTSLVAAGNNYDDVHTVIKTFSCQTLRIYSTNDKCGVELGGALKNVIAVAGGFCDGLQLGDNTRAALITRGLVEIARLGTAMGADEKTFAGLSGLGDLIVTCTSKHSRNHRFGELVAKGMDVNEALKTVGTVEGYHAAALTMKLAKKYNVTMPITAECCKVMYEGMPVKDAVKHLMTRPVCDETETTWIK